MADSADQDLAAVVEKERAQRVIDRLRERGRYDGGRTVVEWTDDTVAVPVTDPPAIDCIEVVRDVGEPRDRTLADHLRRRGWTDAEIDRAPSSWAVVGDVILVRVGDAPRPAELGEALLEVHGGAHTVLARGGISGAHREPDVSVIAGAGDTETVHREHGTAYALDLAEVMFSPGNKAERVRMGEVVREERGTRTSGAASGDEGESSERVLDMFAGVGYFTLPMARAGADVTAIERNPTAFRYLVENASLNDVAERVHPYRADCRDVVEGYAAEAPADRIVMGYYDATDPDAGYLTAALSALAPGGVVHVHEATPDPLVFDRPVDRIHAAAGDRPVEILDRRRVKTHSEGVDHVVVDARIE